MPVSGTCDQWIRFPKNVLGNDFVDGLTALIQRENSEKVNPMYQYVILKTADETIKLEIVQEDIGFFLFRYNQDGFFGDTWHETLEEAKDQAKFEFGINQDWWLEKK